MPRKIWSLLLYSNNLKDSLSVPWRWFFFAFKTPDFQATETIKQKRQLRNLKIVCYYRSSCHGFPVALVDLQLGSCSQRLWTTTQLKINKSNRESMTRRTVIAHNLQIPQLLLLFYGRCCLKIRGFNCKKIISREHLRSLLNC